MADAENDLRGSTSRMAKLPMFADNPALCCNLPPSLAKLMQDDPAVVDFIRSIRDISVEQELDGVGRVKSFDAAADRPDDNGAAMITELTEDIADKYSIDPDEIGCGHYGIIRKGRDRQTGETYAIKSIPKSEAEGKAKGKKMSRMDHIKREVEILGAVSHPRIIRHFGTYEDGTYLHLVTEICTGGMLFDRIVKREKPHPEKEAAAVVASILDAIAYLHDEKNIVHRDIKPENFLFLTDAPDSPLKLIDFGLSRTDPLTVPMRTSIGTAYYVAPEVLDKSYGKSCDLWSIGVVAYMILCGYYPFFGDNTAQIVKHVKTGNFDFPAREWDRVSSHGKEFVNSLLRTEPAERPTAAEALGHKWIHKQTGRPSRKGSRMQRLKQSFSRIGSTGSKSRAVLSKSVHSSV